MSFPSKDWLRRLNLEFRERSLDVRKRPFEAMSRYCRDFAVKGLALGSPEANAIHEWFLANTKRDAHEIGSMLTTTYFYDSCFWPVEIPIGFGQFQLDAGVALPTMPPTMKRDLLSTKADAWDYMIFWANCVDYAYGEDDIQRATPKTAIYGLSLLANADRELRSATSQLLEHRPNAKAAMSCRMSVEIFLKAFLVLETDMKEPAVRAFSHHLDKLIHEVRRASPAHEILLIEQHLHVFPEIRDRYTGLELSSSQLWTAYSVCVHIAAAVCRSFSNRNMKAQVLASGLP